MTGWLIGAGVVFALVVVLVLWLSTRGPLAHLCTCGEPDCGGSCRNGYDDPAGSR